MLQFRSIEENCNIWRKVKEEKEEKKKKKRRGKRKSEECRMKN